MSLTPLDLRVTDRAPCCSSGLKTACVCIFSAKRDVCKQERAPIAAVAVAVQLQSTGSQCSFDRQSRLRSTTFLFRCFKGHTIRAWEHCHSVILLKYLKTSTWLGTAYYQKYYSRTIPNIREQNTAALILITLCLGGDVLPREDVYFYQGNPINTNRVWDASKGQFSVISHVSVLSKFILLISNCLLPNFSIHLGCSAAIAKGN